MNSTDVGRVINVSSKIMWEIDNFCISCFVKIGDYADSPIFNIKDISSATWFLRLYPRGRDENCKDYLSLDACTLEQTRTKIDIKILNNKGEVVKNAVVEDASSQYCRGIDKLISKDFILNPVNNMLNNGKLTIVCEVITLSYTASEIKLKEKEQDAREDAAVSSRLAVLDTYENLMDDNKLSDVSLIAEGKTLKVHKCILANSSSVFATMFNAEMREKQENTVEIADIEYDVLVEMVRFVYAGKVNNIDNLAGQLAVAADKYELEGLKDTCGETMTKNLSVDNVVNCLQLADKLRMDKLKEQAIEFIVRNAAVITAKPEFGLLTDPDILRRVCCGLAKVTIQ